MNEIKPIETCYNGYRFRSRLEARWAVFFDVAGIDYKYEPEGYEISQCYSTAKYYLPDFYLPKFDIFAEVKGSDEQLLNDSGKIGDAIDFLTTPVSTKGLIILGDIPYRNVLYDNRGDEIPVFHMLSWHKGVVSGYCSFLYYFKQKGPHVFNCSKTDFREGSYGFGESNNVGCPIPPQVSVKCKWWDLNRYGLCVDALRTMYPYEKARQARFEHGETPIINRRN